MRLDNGQALEACFAALERAAIAGERCPMNGQSCIDSDYTTGLARAGRIKVEISGRNFRRVTILVGVHAGKQTAPDPTGMRVWKVVDRRGAYRLDAGGTPLYPPRRAGAAQTGVMT